MAKSAAPEPAVAVPGADIARRAQAVAKKVAGLRADLAAAHELVHQAQVREALTRSELTLALGAAMKSRAEAQAAQRQAAAQRYLDQARPAPLRRRDRFTRGFEKLLMRLGPTGQARVIAEAGVWRGDDLAAIQAYVKRGADPLAEPAALFDQGWYLATYPDVATSGLAPLAHYLVHGAPAGLSPHPLILPTYYHQQNTVELAGAVVSPLEHFVKAGAARGRNPHPAFDVLHYAAQLPDLAAGEDPVSHYVRKGWRDGLSPHPLFDPAWYRRQAPRQAAEVPPLVHYLTEGWRAGLSPHPLFDAKWYLEQNPDVVEGGTEPLTHFLTGGAAEGRASSPWFDTAHHIAARGEALDPSINPLTDYLQGGAWAVAEARPGFPTAAYLAQSPELVAAGMTPLEHWARQAAWPASS
ncbi:MAG: hypothetical protein JSR98_13850 [Proteobacteria bacterium]|nr:hypothetical protein [Pseudomonadota bacterium]